MALPAAEHAIRALSAEQGIAALPWMGPSTRLLLISTSNLWISHRSARWRALCVVQFVLCVSVLVYKVSNPY
jgi:hypothetical protein